MFTASRPHLNRLYWQRNTELKITRAEGNTLFHIHGSTLIYLFAFAAKVAQLKNGSTDTCGKENKDQNALKCYVTFTLSILLEITNDNVQLHNFSTSLLTLLEKFNTSPVAMSDCCSYNWNSSWGMLAVVSTYTPPKIFFYKLCQFRRQ
jgi:hypothetical protein